MDLFIKKSTDVTEAERKEFEELFGLCFFGKRRPTELQVREFTGTFKGYSYHCFLRGNGKLMGVYSAVPVRYSFFGKEVVFAHSVDTMIHPSAQGNVFYLKRMAEALYAEMRDDGVSFVWGCPNPGMTKLRCKLLQWVNFGRITYYVAPASMRLYPKAACWGIRSVFNNQSKTSKSVVDDYPELPPPLVGADLKRGHQAPIDKVIDEKFMSYRYGFFPIQYVKGAVKSGGQYVYTAKPYYPVGGLADALSIAYLLDVWPLTEENLTQSIKQITSVKGIDLVFYPTGHLPFKPRKMFRIPTSMEPAPVFCAGRILSDSVDERIFNFTNWNVNLSCGDLV